MDYKKLLAVLFAGVMTPTVGAWANQCMGGTCPAFTLGNVVAPAIPTLLSTALAFSAFLLQPKKPATTAADQPAQK